MLSKFNIVYKTEGDLQISLDVHMPDNAESVPVLVHFHGFGALMHGHRNEITPHMLASVDEYSHALISADYRLAPQVGISEIFDDVKACIEFIRSPTGLQMGDALDTSRLAVAGSSAGGYLALLAGLYVEPKPKCILAMYPITDPFGTCFTDSMPPQGRAEVSTSSVAAVLLSNVVVANSAPTSDRARLHHHAVDTSDHLTFAKHMGLYIGPDARYYEGNDHWRVAKMIAAHRLPPTFLCHGSGDDEADIAQSDVAAGVMVGEQIKCVYERLCGLEHQFDLDRRSVMAMFYEFMWEHV